MAAYQMAKIKINGKNGYKWHLQKQQNNLKWKGNI
jgi:hypothetical protein